MKCKALVTFWKRPEISRLFIDHFEKNKPDYMDLELIPVISPEDEYFHAHKEMLRGYDYLVYKNLPLGEKRNAGLLHCMNSKFDYLLDLGSDDFFNSELWEHYRSHIGKEFFGLKNIYILDIRNNKAIFIRDYAHRDETFGAGRMIRYDVCDRLVWLWENDWNRGLDGVSRHRMVSNGVKETVIDTDRAALMMDVKTNTNIHHFSLLESRGNCVDADWLKEQFDLSGVDLLNPQVFTLLETDEFHRAVCKKAQEMNKEDAFNQINTEYAMNFGQRRYKNYNSYRSSYDKRNNTI